MHQNGHLMLPPDVGYGQGQPAQSCSLDMYELTLL